MKSDCKYCIKFRYDRNLCGFIITSKEDKHNHEIGPELYGHYAENRKLSPEDKKQITEMFEAGAKPSLLRTVFQNKTSKLVLVKDLHNIRTLAKSKGTEMAKLAKVGEDFINSKLGVGGE
ncbi:hypothetical protein JTE90_023016 [Oedothorax gibbosus]|uniref:FAR1 domain-containing protein n=1 Tax=Oedothorax gibbosus TaxID=931172 RepID=A0AAV6TQA6_9ARAC|nr:hypothetical protein JTE90_023016 [Oedothorax gibbosus]